MITSKEHKAAAKAGFNGVKSVASDIRVFYYLEDENGVTVRNKRGESICVEVSEYFPDIKKPQTAWGIKTYVTDSEGYCFGVYNPTLAPDRRHIDTAKVLPATPANLTALLKEVVTMFNAN